MQNVWLLTLIKGTQGLNIEHLEYLSTDKKISLMDVIIQNESFRFLCLIDQKISSLSLCKKNAIIKWQEMTRFSHLYHMNFCYRQMNNMANIWSLRLVSLS